MPNKRENKRPWQPTKKSGFSRANVGQQRRAHDPFYDSKAWKLTRQAQLFEFPLCKHCEALALITPATVVDHINPRSRGGADLDRANLQSLCESCHNRKSRSENNQGNSINT